MKTSLTALPLVLALILAGCRREDVRPITVSLPELTAADTNRVVEALLKYKGVRDFRSSITFDLTRRTVTMNYDSMQIAKTNIRRAIEAAGVKIEEPGPAIPPPQSANGSQPASARH